MTQYEFARDLEAEILQTLFLRVYMPLGDRVRETPHNGPLTHSVWVPVFERASEIFGVQDLTNHST